MATLVYSDIANRAKDRVAANVSTNAPVDATTLDRFINSAWAKVWQFSGGRTKQVASATAWTNAQTATDGKAVGILTDVEEITNVFASTTSGSTGDASGDVQLDRVEINELQFWRRTTPRPSYAVPKLYAITRTATATPASVNLLRIDWWPYVTSGTGFYLPTWYVPQFTPIDSATVTTPDCNDLESLDIALLTAMSLAPLLNRPELVAEIEAELSDNTRLGLERRRRAQMDGKQTDAARFRA